ncbi:glycosyltransferase family 2 protein [Agathobaculum sp.]|uniref:glycosyltransferase family 2 protein n=1 Tax=Agathobaculum sp. TaxID=2048138 RepID=UPI002A8067A7|nr:glycosyltransferase family 2 protein [Agathobaculum sp.]MDY3617570.1 glycosyltransferase family 2 protein [Agathobaculum sp.]
MMHFLETLQFVLFVFFTAAYAYQLVYLAVGFLGRGRQGKQEPAQHRYAAIIAARNEEAVIGELIGSLKNQNYPSELLDIYVVADNCTDGTASCARGAGAIVYERFNQVQKGKGYAMDYLLKAIWDEHGDVYDGYFVFDADNIADPNFVSEMNKMFDGSGYSAITSYRNSRNFCANWISAGYALWFLREARFLNRPRAQLGVNCAVSGTGFLVAADAVREDGGWPYHLLTEDIEFSISCTSQGRKIGYCGTAYIYDEQPTEFSQSWDQRMRWSKGFYQVDAKYTGPLLRGTLCGGRKGFSCYDMLMTIAPSNLITILALFVGLCICFASFSMPGFVLYRVVRMLLRMLWATVKGVSLMLFLYGACTMLAEWRKIDGSAAKKVLYTFTFPLFMLTYVPISLAALMQKVEWKPIRHTGMSVKKKERERV